MLTSWIVAGLVASTLVASPSESQAIAPPSAALAVEVVTANGSGCPNGTATVVAADDNSSFTIIYDDYVAWVGPGAGAAEFRKNCQINLLVTQPEGYTYAITQAEHRGFANIESGAVGVQRTGYYFTGQSGTAAETYQLTGPFAGFYRATEVFDPVIYAPCGTTRNLNINTEVRVSAGTSDTVTAVSLISQGSGGRAYSTYQLEWQQCS